MKRFLLLASLAALIAIPLIWTRSTETAKTAARKNLDRRILYYRDPMHPSYTSDKPGKAPDCGMELVAVYADADYDKGAAAGLEAIRVDPAQQEALGIKTIRVEKNPATVTLRTIGRVKPQETRIFPVTAGGEGWITQLAPATSTGDVVKKGQTLATVYGREYATAERTFLYAVHGLELSKSASVTDYQDQPAIVFREAQLVLENMGFGTEQIEQLTRTRQVILDIKITAPASGLIVAKDAFLQRKFERGAELFRIADINQVWIDADVSEEDSARMARGATAVVTLPGEPGIRFPATISDSLSRFDDGSRTLKLRLEAENRNLRLRPEMIVDVELSLRLPVAVTVPQGTVLRSGSETIAYVRSGPNEFRARAVKTGWRVGDQVQILEGLEAGEVVAASGAFWLNSEGSLRSRNHRHD
jgi:membrane fusion protein, copper/silver efflux system